MSREATPMPVITALLVTHPQPRPGHNLTERGQGCSNVRSLRHRRRSLQTVLPSDRRRRTSRLRSILLRQLTRSLAFSCALTSMGPVRDSTRPRTICVLRHERDDSLRDLNAFKEQNRAWVADVNRWKAEARVPPALPCAICHPPPSSMLTPPLP